MKELVINLRMDRTQEREQTQEAIGDAKRMEDAFKTSVRNRRTAEKAASQASLTEAQVSERAKIGLIKQTNAARIKAAQDAMKVERQANNESIAGTAASVAGYAAQLLSVQKVTSAILQLEAVRQRAAQRQQALQQQAVNTVESGAELAAIMGKPADAAFAKANAQFNVQAGMRPDEGLRFRGAFMNQGAQQIGRNISPKEAEEFEQKAAQLSVARKLEPDVAGQFFGGVLGFQDFSKFGDKAAEKALAVGNEAIEILKRGAGDNPVMVRQLSEFNASMLNEDEFRGAITNGNDSAMLISAAAEKSPTSAREMSVAGIRGLRDFTGDAKPLLDAAKVTPQTNEIEAIRKIAPIIEKEAKDSGMKVDDVLKKYFHDHLTAEAIGVWINKGVNGNVFADREALLAGKIPGIAPIAGAAAAQATIDAHMGTNRAAVRKENAVEDAKLLDMGLDGENADLIRRQAINRLRGRGELDTTAADKEDWWSSLGGLLGDPKELRIDQEELSMLNERGKPFGIETTPFAFHEDDSVEGKNRVINERLEQIHTAQLKELERQNQLTEEANRQRAAQANPNPNKVAPAPIPALRPTRPAPPPTNTRNP